MLHFVFFYTLNENGGAETLMLRLAQWACSHGHKFYIFAQEAKNKKLVAQFHACGTQVIPITGIDRDTVEKIVALGSLESIRVIHFSLNTFSKLEKVRKQMGKEFSTQNYCIHSLELLKGFRSAKPIQEIIKAILRDPMKELIDNHQIFFMDDLSVNNTFSYYRLPERKSAMVVPLPMHVRPYSPPDCSKISYDIITLGRADFPFKGYLLATIRDFTVLKREYPRMKLLVISEGPDLEQLQAEVDGLDPEMRKDVTLRGWVPYHELPQVLATGRVIVGHGTVVLDAINSSRPVIVVESYGYGNQSDGLWGIHTKELGITDHGKPDFAINYIRKIMDADPDVYKSICKQGWEYLNQHYEIDSVMNRLIQFEVQCPKPIPHFWKLKLYLAYINLRHLLAGKPKK